jgi:phospholipid/cholesterol/gamma-HCH transport system substrate-binding protein
MELRYGREVTVGSLVIIAVLVFIFGTMWLSGRSPSSADLLHIRFADVSGLKRASPVRVSGVTVGKVEQIQFESPGNVVVLASLKEKIVPKTDAAATIVSISLVGDYAVDLDPGKAATPLPRETVIAGHRAIGFSDQAAGLTKRADSVMQGLQQMVGPEMVKRLTTTMDALQKTLAATQQTMALYGNPDKGPSAELARTMTQFRQLGARLDSTLANPGLQRALAGSDSLVANLSAMSKNLTATGDKLNGILTDVQSGKGTFGKLASDSALYNNLVKVTAQMDSLMAAIKQNPGKIPITVKLF